MCFFPKLKKRTLNFDTRIINVTNLGTYGLVAEFINNFDSIDNATRLTLMVVWILV